MILRARSTSRSSEQSTKRRSRTVRNVCSFKIKITRLYDYQTWRIHFVRNSRGAQRFIGFFSWSCFSDADWLGRPITWQQWSVQSVDSAPSCCSSARRRFSSSDSLSLDVVSHPLCKRIEHNYFWAWKLFNINDTFTKGDLLHRINVGLLLLISQIVSTLQV